MKKVRFGIVGTGMIGKIFAEEATYTENCTVVAVTSRSESVGKAFAETYGIEKVYTDYQAMLKDPDVDAIYIATPHTFHYRDTIAALMAKKAVLCEKPFAISYEQALEMVDTARSNKVLLMEAMWTRFLPAIEKMKALIEEGAIGELLFVKADFGFRVSKDYPDTARLLNPELGGGALYDVGIYPISMAYHIMGKAPVEIACQKMSFRTGVDGMSTYNFKYDDGSLAVLYSAVTVNTEKQLFISGTKGTISVPSFFCAEEVIYVNEEGVAETFVYPHKKAGYDYEITSFCQSFLAGELENPKMPLDETLNIMVALMDIQEKL